MESGNVITQSKDDGPVLPGELVLGAVWQTLTRSAYTTGTKEMGIQKTRRAISLKTV